MKIEELAQLDRSGRLTRRLQSSDPDARRGPDFVALVRSVAVGNGYVAIEIPIGKEWPSKSDWDLATFEVAEINQNSCMVRPRPWHPKWGGIGSVPDSPAASHAQRRPFKNFAADPFLAAASGGSSSYRSEGQREAVRAALSLPPGATLLAILPTGAGKTLVATVAGFLAKPNLTVIVVPTVSLAIDLEQRFQTEYSITTAIAYHGGLESSEKSSFKERLLSGSQWILVTSPEALLASLSQVVSKIASEGRLANFVVDEAHIVASWGGSFRPSFQALAGYRRHLDQAAEGAGKRFRTILLTGTLDNYGLQILSKLFSDNPISLVFAQVTRPEPSYWNVSCDDDSKKEIELVDALRHLPRPMIVYTSLVEGGGAARAKDVEKWVRSAGFQRVATVTGSTSRGDRETIVSRLRGETDESASADDEVDVVVASSAFGLGIDIENVRTVVHACIPESIDRYYQEVGRGGRDGRASISLVVSAPADREVARKLAQSNNITSKKAWARWKAMRNLGNPSGENLVVSLRAVPSASMDPNTDANRNWNLHTLALMELAGMVRLEWNATPAPPDELDEDQLTAYFEVNFSSVPIRVLQGDLTEGNFGTRIDATRATAKDSSRKSLETILKLLERQDECSNKIFADAFNLALSNGDLVMPEVVCGGCPHCRLRGKVAYDIQAFPEVVPYLDSPRITIPGKLRKLFSEGLMSSIRYQRKLEMESDIGILVERLLKSGVELLVTPAIGATEIRRAAMRVHSRWHATDNFQEWLSRKTDSRLVTCVYVPNDVTELELKYLLNKREAMIPTLLIHATEIEVPNSKNLLSEVVPSWSYADVMREI